MRYLPISLLLLAATPPANAQWRVTLLTGTATTHGDARADTDPAHPELHAERPATATVSIARDAGRWRAGVELHRTGADLAEVGPTSSITTPSTLKAWGIGVELARRVAGESGAAALLLVVGATADRWTFDLAEASPRWRFAARGALEADLAIGTAWDAVIRAELARGPSVFKPEELPEGFSTRAATRVGIVLGLARSIRP